MLHKGRVYKNKPGVCFKLQNACWGQDIRKDSSKIQKENTALNSDILKRMKIIVQLPEGLGKSVRPLSIILLFERKNEKRKDRRKGSIHYSSSKTWVLMLKQQDLKRDILLLPQGDPNVAADFQVHCLFLWVVTCTHTPPSSALGSLLDKEHEFSRWSCLVCLVDKLKKSFRLSSARKLINLQHAAL